MKEILDFLKEFTSLISWPVAVLLLAALFRKPLYLVIKALTGRIEISQEIGIGKDGITLKGIAEKLKETEQKAEDAQKNLNSFIALGGAGSKEVLYELRTKKEKQTVTPSSIKELDQMLKADDTGKPKLEYPDDPQKYKWGGLNKSKGRELNAIITSTPGPIPLYKIELIVVSTSAFHPLTGTVRFHLHPTFPNNIQEVEVVNGKATLQLISYGSFTVGAEADNGQTELELDLAEVEGTTEHFKTT